MTDAEFIRSRKAEIDALFEEYVASFSDENAQGPHPWPNVGEEFCRAIDIAARYIAMWEELRTRLECERGYLVENARKTRTRFYSGAYDWNNTVLRFMEMVEQNKGKVQRYCRICTRARNNASRHRRNKA